MKRRKFLQTGLGATLIGAKVVHADPPSHANVTIRQGNAELSVGPRFFTASEHRQRLDNITLCEQGVSQCLRKHTITDYLPGQCVYNLGEYPSRKIWDPDEWDAQELDRLRDQGIRLIQVHEEWNDSLRRYGGTKFSPPNPVGFRRFVEMVHSRGMKLIVYVSSGFFSRDDPDFRDEWARSWDLKEFCLNYARCSPASASWRAYLLPKLTHILDEYGVDGFYNDLGYKPLYNHPDPPTSDEVLAFPEDADHDGALGDLLARIYAEVKRRCGIVKIHASNVRYPQTDTKVYDYLWVGETVDNIDQLRDAVKNHPPYVVPCFDMSRARIEDENELYLNAIPYMQFPVLLAGRPFTGERGSVPGFKYAPLEQDYWGRHCRTIWQRYQEHPEGPHSYGWWDATPGRSEARPTHTRWLQQYLPLVEEGTRAYLEIGETSLLRTPLPDGVVASLFANRELFLVLANYSSRSAPITTPTPYVSVESLADAPTKNWQVDSRQLLILRRATDEQ